MGYLLIDGHNINSIRYVDDTVLIAGTEKYLQYILFKIMEESAELCFDNHHLLFIISKLSIIIIGTTDYMFCMIIMLQPRASQLVIDYDNYYC